MDSGLAFSKFAVCTMFHSKRLLACDGFNNNTDRGGRGKAGVWSVFLLFTGKKSPVITLV
jgi:hypothetical protein